MVRVAGMLAGWRSMGRRKRGLFGGAQASYPLPYWGMVVVIHAIFAVFELKRYQNFKQYGEVCAALHPALPRERTLTLPNKQWKSKKRDSFNSPASCQVKPNRTSVVVPSLCSNVPPGCAEYVRVVSVSADSVQMPRIVLRFLGQAHTTWIVPARTLRGHVCSHVGLSLHLY